ncbi:unnamed protein product [Brachionus calyciflorus]|uniref:BED-type domain-containing protein n=1 Tax=Brachionus calyciflorus TaxID=104777 RepID=A0A814RXR9_9BILA|nr:unnamed protein product [Brachionus calyciflorus]
MSELQAVTERVVSPGTKRKNNSRRNESFIWNHMIKTELKITCNHQDCSAEYSKSTGNSTLATHLANNHGIHQDLNAGSNDETESATSPKNLRKNFADQERLNLLFQIFSPFHWPMT